MSGARFTRRGRNRQAAWSVAGRPRQQNIAFTREINTTARKSLVFGRTTLDASLPKVDLAEHTTLCPALLLTFSSDWLLALLG